jgi:adenylate kinase family enzyme
VSIVIFGFMGSAGSGKDTAADHLVEHFGFKKFAFADSLKLGVQQMFCIPDDIMFDRVLREQELDGWPGWSVRKLLQYIGTELMRDQFDKDIWVKILSNKILRENKENGHERFAISDVRFPNEIDVVRQVTGSKVIPVKILRDGYTGTKVGLKSHESESHCEMKYDAAIDNNNTFEEFYAAVEKVANKYIGA